MTPISRGSATVRGQATRAKLLAAGRELMLEQGFSEAGIVELLRRTKLPKGSVYTTLEYKINITRAIPLGMKVLATGLILHAGRSTGVATGEVRGVEDGKLYATGSTTCLIMQT